MLHKPGERRSQSLDSLRNVDQDSEPICQTVKSEQKKNSVECGEERGSKSEQQIKRKRSEEKRNREGVKPKEDGELGSHEGKPNRGDLQKGKENTVGDEEEAESGPRRLDENWYSSEYKEDLANRLVYIDRKRDERITMKDCEVEERSQRISMNVDEDEKKLEKTSMKKDEDEPRSQRISVNVVREDEKTKMKKSEDEQRSQRISVNVVSEDEKKNERTNMKKYEDEPRSQRISINAYKDEKKNQKANMKGYEDKQSISMTVYEEEKRNEIVSIESEYREGTGEGLTAPAGEEVEKDASDTLNVARSAALRANSFRRAVDLNRVDSIAVKRSKVQVRSKISEEEQESDEEEEEEDSSESNDEAVLSPKLLPISDKNSSYLGDESVESSEQPSVLRFGQAAPYIAEKWSEICSAFGLQDGNRGACDNSRHSSVSFLSTTFDSLLAEELLTDVTQESFDAEEFLNLNELQEMESGKTDRVSSSRIDAVPKNVEERSQAGEESFEQVSVIDPSVEFLNQISSTPSKADSSIEVEIANPCRDHDDNADATTSTHTENSDALRKIFKEIEQFFPTESSRSNCNAVESNSARLFDASLPVLTEESRNAKPPVWKPGRQSSDVTPQRDGSARDHLKGASVRYSSSLPCLNDGHITSETCDRSVYVGQSAVDCPTLVHSRKLSSSDMTAYFSANKVPTAGGYHCVSSPLSSARSASKGLRKDSNAADAGWTEKQDATGQLERSFEIVGRLSESSGAHDVQSGTSAGTVIDAVFDPSPSGLSPVPQPADKYRSKGRLLFEKVSSPNVPGIGAASQLQDIRTDQQSYDNTKIETSNSDEFAAKSKRYSRGSDGGNDCQAGLSQIRSPSGSKRLSEDIPYREVARRFERQHTYVYRLARAYSSRVKQLQKEAAVYQTTLKRRSLRKWSTVDEGTSRDERKPSLSDESRRDSSCNVPLNRNTVRLAESDLDSSTSARSTVSASSSPFQSTRNSNSVADTWRPISESRAKARSSSRKLSKSFGLSFDGLHDFCFSGGNEESDPEDCFDETQEALTDTNLVKQRVRHFETHKESNC